MRTASLPVAWVATLLAVAELAAVSGTVLAAPRFSPSFIEEYGSNCGRLLEARTAPAQAGPEQSARDARLEAIQVIARTLGQAKFFPRNRGFRGWLRNHDFGDPRLVEIATERWFSPWWIAHLFTLFPTGREFKMVDFVYGGWVAEGEPQEPDGYLYVNRYTEFHGAALVRFEFHETGSDAAIKSLIMQLAAANHLARLDDGNVGVGYHFGRRDGPTWTRWIIDGRRIARRPKNAPYDMPAIRNVPTDLIQAVLKEYERLDLTPETRRAIVAQSLAQRDRSIYLASTVETFFTHVPSHGTKLNRPYRPEWADFMGPSHFDMLPAAERARLHPQPGKHFTFKGGARIVLGNGRAKSELPYQTFNQPGLPGPRLRRGELAGELGRVMYVRGQGTEIEQGVDMIREATAILAGEPEVVVALAQMSPTKLRLFRRELPTHQFEIVRNDLIPIGSKPGAEPDLLVRFDPHRAYRAMLQQRLEHGR